MACPKCGKGLSVEDDRLTCRCGYTSEKVKTNEDRLHALEAQMADIKERLWDLEEKVSPAYVCPCL